MKKFSLRLRLIVSFIVIAALTWGAAALLSLKECREEIDEFFDTYQLMLGRQLAAADWSHVTDRTQLSTDKIIDKIDDAEAEDEAIAFAVFDRSGKMVFNDNEKGKKFVFQPGQELGKFSLSMLKDDEWRILWLSSADNRYIIAVGQELDYRYDVAAETIEELLLPWLCGLGILLLATVLMVSWEFRPLKKLAGQIGSRSPDDLSPLPCLDLPPEIQPLHEALNRLLSRIEGMLQRERSFISDSAHELRSPLTALKIQLEVAQLSEDDAAARNDALQKLGQGIDRSIHLVEQLLALSRLEQSAAMADENLETLDWEQISAAVLDEYQDKIAAKPLKIELIRKGVPFTSGNPVLCSLLLRNLIDNAVKYSPPQAAIQLILEDGKLEVVNSATEVKSEVLNRIKERFYRPAGQKESGSGLGLAIVEKIASLHHCRLELQNTPRGFSAKIVSAR